jgi:tetratricopeptide (TPR) repeat protein
LLRGLELNPLSPQLALRLGQVLFALDQPEQALPQLRTATEGLPDDTEAWFRYAACLAELGYAEEAEQAKVHHGRLVQMGEFQVPGELTWSERLEVLAQRLEESGDLAGAAALRQP